MIGDLGDPKLREIRLLFNRDGSAALFVIVEVRGKRRWYLRSFAENEEVGDLRQYTDGTSGEAEYLKWPRVRGMKASRSWRAAA